MAKARMASTTSETSETETASARICRLALRSLSVLGRRHSLIKKPGKNKIHAAAARERRLCGGDVKTSIQRRPNTRPQKRKKPAVKAVRAEIGREFARVFVAQ